MAVQEATVPRSTKMIVQKRASDKMHSGEARWQGFGTASIMAAAVLYGCAKTRQRRAADVNRVMTSRMEDDEEMERGVPKGDAKTIDDY